MMPLHIHHRPADIRPRRGVRDAMLAPLNITPKETRLKTAKTVLLKSPKAKRTDIFGARSIRIHCAGGFPSPPVSPAGWKSDSSAQWQDPCADGLNSQRDTTILIGVPRTRCEDAKSAVS